jgi:hypothetical protein
MLKKLLIVIAVAISGCAGATQPLNFQKTEQITRESYLQNKGDFGVVLMDINWGRWWGCGSHENAQLISLAFDKLPVKSTNNEIQPSLVIHSPSRLMVDPEFINYAFSLEPAEYAISSFSIKVSDSSSKVGFLTARRNHLYKDGQPIGGTFTVKANETVFIGNFFLDCAHGPILWRYYSDGKEAFQEQIQEYKSTYPFLDLSDVKFRLFKTKEFGIDYELPQ